MPEGSVSVSVVSPEPPRAGLVGPQVVITYQCPATRLTGKLTQVALVWNSTFDAIVVDVQEAGQSTSLLLEHMIVQQLSELLLQPVDPDDTHCAAQVPGLTNVFDVQG